MPLRRMQERREHRLMVMSRKGRLNIGTRLCSWDVKSKFIEHKDSIFTCLLRIWFREDGGEPPNGEEWEETRGRMINIRQFGAIRHLTGGSTMGEMWDDEGERTTEQQKMMEGWCRLRVKCDRLTLFCFLNYWRVHACVRREWRCKRPLV